MLPTESVLVPGIPNGEMSNWTLITKKIKASTEPNLPCPTTGCTASDWDKLWNKDGWNDIRIQFYGATAANTGKVHMKSWFKKTSSSVWVPIIQDTTLAQVVPKGRIGLLVHGGGRFAGPKGTWYRNIRWRPLDDKGIAKVALASEAMALEVDQESPLKVGDKASVVAEKLNQNRATRVRNIQGRILTLHP